MAKDKLTPKQEMFVKEYLVDLNATQAYLRAGYNVKSEDVAAVNAKRLLSNAKIEYAIQEAMNKRTERTEITADAVLQRWWDIATADPNEIIHLRRVCCRHCYGKEYQYQWRDAEEYQQAVQHAIRSAKEDETPLIPDNTGGYGYNKLARPNAHCPYCSGEGNPEVHVEDTRDLGPKARLLYAGIKQTREGIEVKFQDQAKALENVAKHLGMFVEKHEHTGKDGGPIQTQGLTDEELDSKIKRLMGQVTPDDS